MGKIDITLRDIIQEIPPKFVQLLSGKNAKKLLDTSLPEVKERRAYFLVELEDGSIFHLELQTQNDKNMPFRMLEYFVLISSKYPNKKIKQMVLYVGEKPLNMKDKIEIENLTFSYELKDIREISCEELFKSDSLTDKILAVLCDVRNPEKYFRGLLTEFYKLPERERRDYLKKLLNLLTIRSKLVEEFKIEVKKMPITFDRETMKKHPFFKDGKEEGLKEGLEKGLQKGLEKGKLEAKREAVINLHQATGWNAEKIAEVLKLPLDFVKDILEK